MRLNKKNTAVLMMILFVTLAVIIVSGFKWEVAGVYNVMKQQFSDTSTPEVILTEETNIDHEHQENDASTPETALIGETTIEQPIVLKQLEEKIWASALEHHDIELNDWVTYTLNDFRNIDETAPIHFRTDKKENKELSEALYHESLSMGIQNALQQHIQKGDSKPLFLVHTELREVKITFQRDYGQGDFVVLTLKEQNDEKQIARVVIDDINSNSKFTKSEIGTDQGEQIEILSGVFWSDVTVTTGTPTDQEYLQNTNNNEEAKKEESVFEEF